MEENYEKLLKSVTIKQNISESLTKNKNRNSGIDLIRIISMYGIVINHIMYREKTFSKYKQFKKLKLLHILLFWHNNGFIFISRFIGYKSHKYSNLLYLWISVFFYSVIIHIIYLKYKPQFVKNDKLYYSFFLIIFNRYWFFIAYFGMYLFLPIINKGIAYLNKSELKFFFISLMTLFVLWHDIMNLKNDVFITNKGFSVLWLLIFYIVGAYFGKYKIKFFETKKFYYFLTNFLIYMIIQSISIILFLSEINYNKYLGKIISSIGTLIFGVYLIHDNIFIRNDIMNSLLDNEKNNILKINK